MIKNDRQYRLTKSQLRNFEEALSALDRAPAEKGIDPALIEIQRRALESQREELASDIQEYEALRDGKVFNFSIQGLDALPESIIKARIALGLTQKELADRLELKEQQVQRWEANDYAGASIDTLKEVMGALGVETIEEVFVPSSKLTAAVFLKNLAGLGLSKEFLLSRVFPAEVSGALSASRETTSKLKPMLQAAGYVSRVFGTQVSQLFDLQTPRLALATIGGVRFKLPSRAKETTVNAYTVYAHYLGLLVESCVKTPPISAIPEDWSDVYKHLTTLGSPISLQKTLRYLWDCGIIILPLRDSGAFHGAVWKIRDHFVIVLKQKTALESRWLFDLLHELAHIVLRHVTDNSSIIEEHPIALDNPGDDDEDDEDKASEWAEDALFDGESEAIEEECARSCKEDLKLLSGAIGKVAKNFNVNLGALANHMAHRLASEGEDWWGSAHNLQSGASDPFDIARVELLKRVDLRNLNIIDRDLLMRAITEDEP
jgi:transcriptional regulator with XRE-family HTH domain